VPSQSTTYNDLTRPQFSIDDQSTCQNEDISSMHENLSTLRKNSYANNEIEMEWDHDLEGQFSI
jgi:hypothetical protein